MTIIFTAVIFICALTGFFFMELFLRKIFPWMDIFEEDDQSQEDK
jgi:hypothetical protein